MAYNIKLKNIEFAFEASGKILDGVSFTANAGEVIAIISGVGGGKSTFLKVCSGLLEPEVGDVIIGNKNVWNLSTIERNEMRSTMGFDFQESALIANMTIAQNLMLPLNYHRRLKSHEAEKQIEDWLKKLKLIEFKDSLPAALSFGLRRRVSFIRSMLCGSEAFFWDEPAQAADELYWKVISETITRKKGAGILSIVATQSRFLLEDVCDRFVLLDGGKIVLEGDVRDSAKMSELGNYEVLRR